jgi:hypothetical protein
MRKIELNRLNWNGCIEFSTRQLKIFTLQGRADEHIFQALRIGPLKVYSVCYQQKFHLTLRCCGLDSFVVLMHPVRTRQWDRLTWVNISWFSTLSVGITVPSNSPWPSPSKTVACLFISHRILHDITYAVELVGFGHWDRGFESRSRHEYVSASFYVVLSCR